MNYVNSKRILLLLGYGLAVLSLVWVLHDFHIMQELRRMARPTGDGCWWEWPSKSSAMACRAFAGSCC